MAGNHPHSIADLRIYQLALSLEEKAYKLVQGLGQDRFELANDLRRASAGVAHHIFESYRRYSYQLKIDHLHAAREEAEAAIKLLEQYEQSKLGQTEALREEFTSLIKQSWGLIKWHQKRQAEKEATATVEAKDELVAARQ